MTKIDPKQTRWFVSVAVIISIVIVSMKPRSPRSQNEGEEQQRLHSDNSVSRFSQSSLLQQQAASDEAARKAAAEQEARAAVKHAQYLERYLNTGFSRSPGIQSVAIIAASENGQINHTLSTALANHFKTPSVAITSSLFKSEFVTDGLFTDLFGGSTAVLNNLELIKSLDGVLLARQTVEYSKDPTLENVVSAHIQLDITVVPVSAGIEPGGWTFRADGAGFTEAAARAMAEERLIKQVEKDTKMSFGQNPQSK